MRDNAYEAATDAEIYEAEVTYARAKMDESRAAKAIEKAMDNPHASLETKTYLAGEHNKAMDAFRTARDDRSRANAKYTGWSRYFLVNNTNGHIHPSMNCSTCTATTNYNWLTDLSGLTLPEVVAEYGEIVCSVCYPEAPSEWSNGVNKKDADRKAAEAALKAVAKSAEGKDVIRHTDKIRYDSYNRKTAHGNVIRAIEAAYEGYESGSVAGTLMNLDRIGKYDKSIKRAKDKLVLATAALEAALSA